MPLPIRVPSRFEFTRDTGSFTVFAAGRDGMMNNLDCELEGELADLSAAGLRRSLREITARRGVLVETGGRSVRNFSSNDYLGLAGHPQLVTAAERALHTWGAGSGASRLVCGSLTIHHQLEEGIAGFLGVPAALAFSTGYAAAIGVIPALVGPGDVVILDKKVHASCADAARLSGATIRVFRHNDCGHLEAKLRWADQRAAPARGPVSGRKPRTLVVVESVYSMDGDLAWLREVVELKDRYGAWLMVDEAHATGLFGERRTGLAEAFELASRVDVHFGTLSKAIGASGGFVGGSRALVDLLVNRARSFIFSTAPVPAAAAAALAGMEVVRSSEGADRCARVWALVDWFKNGLIRAGWKPGPIQSPIIPLMVHDESKAMQVSAALLERGMLVPAIRFPTVARGQARLRVLLSAEHTTDDLEALLGALTELQPVVST